LAPERFDHLGGKHPLALELLVSYLDAGFAGEAQIAVANRLRAPVPASTEAPRPLAGRERSALLPEAVQTSRRRSRRFER
jgi:hypothetical protein